MGTATGAKKNLKPWRYTMTPARLSDRKRGGNAPRSTDRPRPANSVARSVSLPTICRSSLAFAALRAALHDGPPAPPHDWPEHQDRLLGAQHQHEKAFLAFAA